jgi:aromatic ring hydroxylase-like protein
MMPGHGEPRKHLLRRSSIDLDSFVAGQDSPVRVREVVAVDVDPARRRHLRPRCTWLRNRQTAPGGAILVRPDRFVAWRSMSVSDEAVQELTNALAQILANPLRVLAEVSR